MAAPQFGLWFDDFEKNWCNRLGAADEESAAKREGPHQESLVEDGRAEVLGTCLSDLCTRAWIIFRIPRAAAKRFARTANFILDKDMALQELELFCLVRQFADFGTQLIRTNELASHTRCQNGEQPLTFIGVPDTRLAKPGFPTRLTFHGLHTLFRHAGAAAWGHHAGKAWLKVL